MVKTFLFLLPFFISTHIVAQRNSNLGELTPSEIKQKRFEDSMQQIRAKFEHEFNITEYFKKQRALRLKNDTARLNETLEYFKNLEAVADTVTQLTIQSSALAVFPVTIKNFKKLKFLSLRRCQSVHLESLFDQLKDLPELSELQIIFSEKTELPENINLLRNLRVLDLNGNKIYELPKGLSNMVSLEVINLHNNPNLNLDSAFKVLKKCSNLKIVKLSGCKIVSLGENLGKLNQIEELDLNLNSIERMPTNLDGLVKLRRINMSKNSKLDPIQVFSALATIPNLEELVLSDCSLSELHSGIGAIKKLKRLDITNNSIKKIAPEIGNLSVLEELMVGAGALSKESTPIAEIPADIGKCTQLRKVSFVRCQLTSLPTSFSSLENLNYLDLSWNQLKKFPEPLIKLSLLRYLNLSNNKISEIPSDLGLIPLSLEAFLLEANFYAPYDEKIIKIPPSLVRCKKLKILSLKDQLYESLPDRFWFDLTQLEDLNLMGGLLNEIPDAIENLVELRSLNMKSNEIRRVSSSITKLKKLEKLNLSYNPDMDKNEVLNYISKMPQLQMVDLSYNDIPRELIEPIAAQMKQTKFVKLETKDSPVYEKSRSR